MKILSIILGLLATASAIAQTNNVGSISASGSVTAVGAVTGGTLAGNGAAITALSGANITAGTLNSNVMDAPTKAQLALAAAPASAFPPPYAATTYAKNRFVQAEFPNGSGIVSFGAVSSTVTGTASSAAVAAGFPIGVQFVPVGNAGGICGENIATAEWWSTNSATTVWDVSYVSDVSSNRLWNCIGTSTPAGIDQVPKTYGFMKPSTNANWVAYSNDGTITNNVVTSVTVTIGTFYHLVTVKSNTSITYYLNGVSVATNTWNPTAAGVRHNWGGNALNSQASGVVLYYFYNEHTP